MPKRRFNFGKELSYRGLVRDVSRGYKCVNFFIDTLTLPSVALSFSMSRPTRTIALGAALAKAGANPVAPMPAPAPVMTMTLPAWERAAEVGSMDGY